MGGIRQTDRQTEISDRVVLVVTILFKLGGGISIRVSILFLLLDRWNGMDGGAGWAFLDILFFFSPFSFLRPPALLHGILMFEF